VLSTGDELVSAGEPLGPGQIRDANRPMLLALVAEAGCTPVDLGIVGDDRDALRTAITGAVARCDALVTSGGVSVGDFDLSKAVLDELGDMRWMQIAIRPAKPFAFGVVDGTPVFGLPGNPVSSLVSFELLARPALRRLMGHTVLHRPEIAAVADAPFERTPDGKTHYVRVTSSVGGDGRVHVAPVGGQGSHQLAAMAGADALVVLPDGEGAPAGADVRALLLR
jgi:molybdenum cofactor synthesis domain-containing protein